MALSPSYTVSQIAHALKVSPPTVRAWARDYSAFLSSQATPAPEQERLFDDDDLAVLMTVKTLRSQREKHPAIVERLAAGERLEPPDAPPPPPRASSGRIIEQEPAPAGDAIRAFESALTVYQGQVTDLTNRLIAAEVGRAAAEVELKLLKARLTEEQPAPAADAPAAPPASLADALRGWWRGRKK